MAYEITSSTASVASETTERGRDRTDVWGIFCSVGCAIHCAATPVLISTLPSFSSLEWLADPLFHQVVSIVCVALVARAIVPGWKKHRSDRVAILATSGVSLLLLAAFILPENCCNHSSTVAPLDVSSRNVTADNEMIAAGVPSPFRLVSTRPVNSNPVNSNPTNTAPVNTSPSRTAVACSSLEKQAWGRTLLSEHGLFEAMGYTAGQTILRAQPYLSPLGGVLLILAHVLNIRLRCCKAGGCDPERDAAQSAK